MENLAGMGKRLVTVIVDGNNHNLAGATGKRAIVQTEIVDNVVTIDKCRDIAEKITAAGHAPKRLVFMLSIYGDDGDMDNPATCFLNMKVTYDVKHDDMIVWRDEQPVYANTSGNECYDTAAIWDCMGDC